MRYISDAEHDEIYEFAACVLNGWEVSGSAAVADHELSAAAVFREEEAMTPRAAWVAQNWQSAVSDDLTMLVGALMVIPALVWAACFCWMLLVWKD